MKNSISESSKREKVEAALAGEVTDRPPISVWRHFYEYERTAEGLAESMLDFQNQYDWDFMKVNPRAQYHVEEWGTRYHYSRIPTEAPVTEKVPISSVEDWGNLKPLSPLQGSLGEHLKALSIISKKLRREVPLVTTIFTPLAIAGYLVDSDEQMVRFLRENPKETHTALEVITESFRGFSTECLNAGAEGIFLATTHWASRDLISEEEYEEFGRPYDLRILAAVVGVPFNILHVCRGQNMLQSLVDYPVNALSWDTENITNSSLEEARSYTKLALIGGVDRNTLLNGRPEEVTDQVHHAIEQSKKGGLMIGPSCSISPKCSEGNLRALRRAVADGII